MKVRPQVTSLKDSEGNETDIEVTPFFDKLEADIKNVLFEHSYLNEKIIMRNNKTKKILYPTL